MTELADTDPHRDMEADAATIQRLEAEVERLRRAGVRNALLLIETVTAKLLNTEAESLVEEEASRQADRTSRPALRADGIVTLKSDLRELIAQGSNIDGMTSGEANLASWWVHGLEHILTEFEAPAHDQ